MFKKKNTHTQLNWIDEFIHNVKPYIFVRPEDNLLIKRPNQATKINQMGALLLSDLLNGNNIGNILQKLNPNEQQLNEINQFFIGVKQYLEGQLDIFTCNPAVEKKAFEMNYSKYPVLSELALTYKCNLKCRFCYAGCNCTVNPAGSEKELNTAEFKDIITGIYNDAKVPSISFTGGEPTMVKELPELITHAKKLGMRVNLISNGTLITKDKAKAYVDAGLDSVQISLEGVTRKTHELLTDVKGSFDKTVAAIGYLKNLNIHTHTNTTLTRLNLDEACLFPEFIKNVLGNDKFSMNFIIPTGSTNFNDELVISYNEIGSHLVNIQNVSKKTGVEFMWYSPVPMCMFNTITHELGNKGCAACDGLLSVAPNGDVLPCASYDESVGNMHALGFQKVWDSKQATHYRKKEFAHDICKKCEHFAICNGACPLYWRAIGYRELEETNCQLTKNPKS